MTEGEAKSALNVPCETLARLEAFADLLREENARQNLVSKASLDHLWSRHVLDSAQLLPLAPPGAWVDLGTGAGFPGLVTALLRPDPTTLIESRRLRADFLSRAIAILGIADRAEVLCAKVETLPVRRFAVISARAFAPMDKLLTLGERFADDRTIWLLPKGRNAQTELAAAGASWQGDFRLEPSVTDPDSWIVVAGQVRRRVKGNKAR